MDSLELYNYAKAKLQTHEKLSNPKISQKLHLMSVTSYVYMDNF